MPWDNITTADEYRASPNDDPFQIADPGGAVGDLIAGFWVWSTSFFDVAPSELWAGGTSSSPGDYRGVLGWLPRDGTEPANFTFTPSGPITSIAASIINIPASVPFEESQAWAGVLDLNDTPVVYSPYFPPELGHPASGARGPLTIPLIGVGVVLYISADNPGTVMAPSGGAGTFDSTVEAIPNGSATDGSYNLFAYEVPALEVGRFPLGAPSGSSNRDGLWFAVREAGTAVRRRWYLGVDGWSG